MWGKHSLNEIWDDASEAFNKMKPSLELVATFFVIAYALVALLYVGAGSYRFSLNYKAGETIDFGLLIYIGTLAVAAFFLAHASLTKLFGSNQLNIGKIIVMLVALVIFGSFYAPYVLANSKDSFDYNFKENDLKVNVVCNPVGTTHFVTDSSFECYVDKSREMKRNESLSFYLVFILDNVGFEYVGPINLSGNQSFTANVSNIVGGNMAANGTFIYRNESGGPIERSTLHAVTFHSREESEKINMERAGNLVQVVAIVATVLFFGINQLWEIVFTPKKN